MLLKMSTLPSDRCLQLRCMIGKEPIDFLLDIGVPVTLQRRDTWGRVNSKSQNSLQPWEEHRLVGINGSPIQVHRQCMINTKLEGNNLPMNVIVVSHLTIEAILGLDFLVKMKAEINVKKKIGSGMVTGGAD